MDVSEKPVESTATSAFRGLFRPVVSSAVFFMIVAGVVYPLLTAGVAQVLFPTQAQGSLIMENGQPVGSRLIGQYFKQPRYFHGRPSATVGADPAHPSGTIGTPYDAAASGASNQGVLSKALLQAVAGRARAYRQENGLRPNAEVPVDAVTASGSGLDPGISLANARLQAPRVAGARGWPV